MGETLGNQGPARSEPSPVQAVYMDFNEYLQGLSEEQSAKLAKVHLVFCFPILDRNEFDLIDHPVSQRILMAVAKRAGCHVEGQVITVDNGQVIVPPIDTEFPTHIVIHPTIGSLEGLAPTIKHFNEEFPETVVILHNSDQHQHEKMIGGPGGNEIANHLLSENRGIDWVIVGYAEHALLGILIGEVTSGAIGINGKGLLQAGFFKFRSLPLPQLPSDWESTRSGTIRVQRSRGCLAPCTYCIEGQANRSNQAELPWDGVSMGAFVDYLEDLHGKGYFFINVVDSSFEDPGRRGLQDLIGFCQEVLRRDLALSFKIHLRAETILKLEKQDFRLMKNAGIDVIIIGIESGSQTELDYYRKIASSDVSKQAFWILEEQGLFCVILGYIMFSPISSISILQEKLEFMRDIGRGWDFLNLTNRLRVYWGTLVHKQLLADGLAEQIDVTSGYVPIKFRDPLVEKLDLIFNEIKHEHPGYLRLNTVIYDAMNLESRMTNPANQHLLKLAGRRFDSFKTKLSKRQKRLSELYVKSFRAMVDNPAGVFLADFDPEEEARLQESEVNECLEFIDGMDQPPTTLELRTWLSVFDRFGHKEK